MGRIKSTMIKRAAKQMLRAENTFSEGFENNKKLLNGFMPSKPIKNKVAGYLARLKRMEKQIKPIKPKEAEEPEKFV